MVTDGGPQADEAYVFTDDMYEGGVGAPGLPGYNEMGKAPLGKGELTYRGMNILAPMVRVNTLAFRLLALDCGADMVYSEEVIDHRFVQCKRVVNSALNSVDFVDSSTGIVVFPLFPPSPSLSPPPPPLPSPSCAEKTRVAFQIGTADAVRALRAAEMVCNDVAAIDINMGCPKPFSTSGGMGSALLSRPENACDILSTLRRNLPASITVTCKIRLLDSPHRTLDFARAVESTGISALGIHARKVPHRPSMKAQWEALPAVVSSLSLPVIANGDVFCYSDFDSIRAATGEGNSRSNTKEALVALSAVVSSLSLPVISNGAAVALPEQSPVVAPPSLPVIANGDVFCYSDFDSIRAGTVVSSLSLPVIANGDVFSYSDFDSIRAATGASSAMAARAALWNPTVFRPEGQQKLGGGEEAVSEAGGLGGGERLFLRQVGLGSVEEAVSEAGWDWEVVKRLFLRQVALGGGERLYLRQVALGGGEEAVSEAGGTGRWHWEVVKRLYLRQVALGGGEEAVSETGGTGSGEEAVALGGGERLYLRQVALGGGEEAVSEAGGTGRWHWEVVKRLYLRQVALGGGEEAVSEAGGTGRWCKRLYLRQVALGGGEEAVPEEDGTGRWWDAGT
ncbi:unnamed protein product [Closterium sp. NIES-64]|nr:unnamed protein product [Closterium sp. NIES-64]